MCLSWLLPEGRREERNFSSREAIIVGGRGARLAARPHADGLNAGHMVRLLCARAKEVRMPFECP